MSKKNGNKSTHVVNEVNAHEKRQGGTWDNTVPGGGGKPKKGATYGTGP